MVIDGRQGDVRPDFIPDELAHLFPGSGGIYRDFVADEVERDPGNVPKDPKRPVDPRDNRHLERVEQTWRAQWGLEDEEFVPATSIGEWQARIRACDEPPAKSKK